ncbi:MAG: hypothetical protein ACTSYT_04345 [Candidatus Asgardarchaeia archaeon]
MEEVADRRDLGVHPSSHDDSLGSEADDQVATLLDGRSSEEEHELIYRLPQYRRLKRFLDFFDHQTFPPLRDAYPPIPPDPVHRDLMAFGEVLSDLGSMLLRTPRAPQIGVEDSDSHLFSSISERDNKRMEK